MRREPANRIRLSSLVALACCWALGGAQADGAEPTILFLIAEPEYQTATTLPEFAAHELAPRGLHCVFAFEDPADPNDFSGLEALPSADLLVVSVRRHAPSREHLALVRAHLAAGKPLIGIRTASHAFALKPRDEQHDCWMDFDRAILGGSYDGHYGDVPAVLALAPGAAGHPVLAGVDLSDLAPTRLYKNQALAASATSLITGRSQGAAVDQHVAWTNQVGASRVFYTSLGMAGDFARPAFRRLLSNAVAWALAPAPRP